MREKNPPELEQLLFSLEKLSDQLQVSDLKWYFNLMLCEIDDITMPLAQLVKSAYPMAYPEQARIAELSQTEMIERMNWWLSGGKSLRNKENFRARPVMTEYSDLIWLMTSYIDFGRSGIYEYIAMNPNDRFGKEGILSNFAFVIVDQESKHVLFFEAGQCD